MPARLTCRARPETRRLMSQQPTDAQTSAARPIGVRIRFYLLLALGAWALRSLIVAPFSIPSGSMLPTMAIGDYLFVAKWPFGYSRYSFPFQVPPMMVGVQVAGLQLSQVLRISVPLALASFFVLLPLDFLWWRLIGYFGKGI